MDLFRKQQITASEEKIMSNFNTGSGSIDYETIRKAMNNEPFTMSLTDEDEIKAVIIAVNEGIDGHLEACFCPDRGDRYEGGERKSGKLLLCRTLECSISSQSLPVLLRRLSESDLGNEEINSAGSSLAMDILSCLGINEFEKFVGREALGSA